jgi:hypothetical protein
MIRDPENKRLATSPQRPRQTQFNACNTGVYPVRSHGFGVWGNRRVVMSVRVDERLKKEATRVLKAVYGSTCRGIESYLAGLVATYEQQGVSGVYPSHTSIGQLVIERNIRTRRKLETRTYEEETTERNVTVSCCDFCGKPLVIARFRHVKSGMEKNACGFDAEQLRVRDSWIEVPVRAP